MNKRENVSTVCSGAAVLSTVKIKVGHAVKIKVPRTHRPNRKTYRLMPIFEKCQILADILALVIYRSTTNAYFHIQIHLQHRQFLKFAFQGKIYEFKVLPFGLSLAPRIFTKCVEAALTPLRQQGIRILAYLDDWLICARSKEMADLHTKAVLMHLNALGFVVNQKKSLLTPTQSIMFLDLKLSILPGNPVRTEQG